MTRSTRWSVAFICLMVGGVTGFLAKPFLQGQAPAPPAVPKELTSYRDVVKKVLPAVVSIEARAKPAARMKDKEPPPRRRPQTDDLPFPEEFRKFFEELERRQLESPEEAPNLGFGSGFLVDPKGAILTNYHVVDGADQVKVQLSDGRKFVSKDIHGDRKTDLAIIRIEAKTPLPYLELGDSDAMAIGDRVLAAGAPFGLAGSVTQGIISAKGRNGLIPMTMYEDFLQTDAAINPGNSGGPLVNLEGKVIGINTAIKTRSGGFQGVGLAIASNLAKNVMDQLLKEGTVRRGYLGVGIDNLDPEVAARLGLKEQIGVLVTKLLPNSPATKGGLQSGDVITGVGGQSVKDRSELQRLVASLPVGKPVEVAVVRDGQAKTLPITIEEQPGTFDAARVPTPRSLRRDKKEKFNFIKLDKIGIEVIEVADLDAESLEQLGYEEGIEGAFVIRVSPGSAADEAGLSSGMLIVKMDKKPVKSASDLRDALEKAPLEKGVLFQVQSPRGGTHFVVVKVEPAK